MFPNREYFAHVRRILRDLLSEPSHWRLGGAVYFLTWRIHKAQHILGSSERDLIVSALRNFSGKRYDLIAFVVMDDHVHVVVQPFEKFQIQEIVHSWKSFSANQMQKKFNRVGAIWQAEYFDRIIRDDTEYFEKARYIMNNPIKRWPEIEEYKWVWVKGQS
ncbi:MAG: transposase [bacterium]